MKHEGERKRILRRWEALKKERASWMAHWREISEHISPRSGRFLGTQQNRGGKKHHKIYDNTPIRALSVLSAGLMGGLTSPSRPWFKLATANEELNQVHSVKVWLSELERLMQTVFQRSNVYGTLHTMYEELGAYGTAACVVLPDFDDVIRCYPLTVGEYALACNWRGEVDTLYREFDKTVAELVEEFGLDRVSDSVRRMYERGQYDEWVTVVHAIEPRRERDVRRPDALNMPFRSVYLEKGGEEDVVLRESGFERFPVLCPRWNIYSGDVYGASPAMNALGDIKQLQHEQLRKSTVIDYQTNPPLQAPTSMKTREVDMLPGGISYYDATGAADGVRTAFNVNLDLNHLLADIGDVRERVNAAFFADLFLMISGSRQDMTATEVAERHEEKMLMLGPVLERLQNELIDPLIELAFYVMVQADLVPPPPDELRDGEVNVVLLSILAQAQRAIGVNSIDRFVGAVTAVSQVKPEVLDNFDADKWVEVYADSLGIDPRLVADPKTVEAQRVGRAQQMAAQQQMGMLQQGADVAQTLAQAQALGGGQQPV